MDNFDLKKYLVENKVTRNSRMLTENENFSVELLVPTIYFNVETGELAKSEYDFGSESELEDMDITSYSDGEELIEWVFDNNYDTAKSFEREYPGLFKVVKAPDSVSMRVFLEKLNINPEDPLFASAIEAGNIEEVITLLIDTAGNGDTENPFDGVYTQSDFSEAARAAQFSEEMIDELLSMTPIRTLEKG